jgi:hypothetical protein
MLLTVSHGEGTIKAKVPLKVTASTTISLRRLRTDSNREAFRPKLISVDPGAADVIQGQEGMTL